MAEPTEADRTKAMLLAPHAPMCTSAHTGPACVCGRWKLWPAIAQQLADERERARAPFLALAEEIMATPTPLDAIPTTIALAASIRRAAEETGQ